MNKLLFLIILTISSGLLFSQTRIRTQSYLPDFPPYSVFHTEVPILQNLPPILPSMPYNLMLSYVALDSFSRLNIKPKVTENWLKNMNTDNDTLHTLWKYAYEMMDYDPLRIYQFLNDQDIERSIYRNISTYNFYRMIGKIGKINNSKNWQLYAALNSMYILRVIVLSIDSMKSSIISLGDSNQFNHYQITCIVTDTIKGKVIPMSLPDNNLNSKNFKSNSSYNYPTFKFITTSYSSPQFINATHFTPQFKKVDSLIFDFSRMIMRLKPGQEVIVFLQPTDCIWTKTHDYVRLVVAYPYSGGVLPIVNGMVSDINKIWSDSTLIPYNSWKGKYNEAVDIIMTKGY